MSWYNQTAVPPAWNAYTLTMYVTKCNVQAEFYGPPLNEHFITAVNGVAGRGALSWGIWLFCPGQNAWSYSKVGADLIALTNGQTLAWILESSSNSPPVPGSNTVNTCS